MFAHVRGSGGSYSRGSHNWGECLPLSRPEIQYTKKASEDLNMRLKTQSLHKTLTLFVFAMSKRPRLPLATPFVHVLKVVTLYVVPRGQVVAAINGSRTSCGCHIVGPVLP